MNESETVVDFLLRAVEDPDGGYVVSDATGEQASFPGLLTPISIERLSFRMAGRRTTRSRTYTLEDQRLAQTVGEKLFSALISGPIETSYRARLEEVSRSRKVLRVVLDLTKAQSLLNYPWEFLYDTAYGSYLSATRDSSFMRLFSAGAAANPKPVSKPLKVLAVSARPRGVPDLNIDAEIVELKNAASKQLASAIAVEHIDNPTLGELGRWLDSKPFGYYDILHFIGHGRFSGDTRTGTLSFRVDGSDLVDDVNPHRFTNVLWNRGIRLAVLNACEGGRTDLGDPFAGVAISLLRAKFAAVIAMQFEITDSAATEFSGHLYRSLAKDIPIDVAVADARRQMFIEQETLEWATPVLYLSDTSGLQLFRVTGAGETTRTTTDIGDPEIGSKTTGGDAAGPSSDMSRTPNVSTAGKDQPAWPAPDISRTQDVSTAGEDQPAWPTPDISGLRNGPAKGAPLRFAAIVLGVCIIAVLVALTVPRLAPTPVSRPTVDTTVSADLTQSPSPVETVATVIVPRDLLGKNVGDVLVELDNLNVGSRVRVKCPSVGFVASDTSVITLTSPAGGKPLLEDGLLELDVNNCVPAKKKANSIEKKK